MRVLKNECGISQGFDPNAVANSGDTQPEIVSEMAIWDTGATECVITQTIIDKCGLIPTGMANVQGVHGVKQSETFLVNIYLPNKVVFTNIRVTKGEISGANILIGMNIITKGDFAITNREGRTKFTFRIPSLADIDFVQQKPKSPNQDRARKKTRRKRKR